MSAGQVPGFGNPIVACQNAAMKIPEPLILYARADCHLCDQVIGLLDRNAVRWRPVDIDGDRALLEKYGLRIPVLKRPDTGAELFYPFDEERLRQFVSP
jgi:hypothetical protein